MSRQIIIFISLVFGCVVRNANMAYLDANSFFNVKGNLTKITWAHAVNNQTLLRSALSSNVMMLEADVVIGNLTTNINATNVPIMAHPPATSSDLSLQMFLNEVLDYNNNSTTKVKKGVKLDFKSIDALEQSVSNITNLYNSMNYPVWINADIIPGPQNAQTTPVDPARFFGASRHFTNSTLSIGWTTNYVAGVNISYTDAQINSMITSMKDNAVVDRTVTFPVRAGIAAESISQMNTLIRNYTGSTLTIWSSENDQVNVTNLRSLIRQVGINRTYIDVPESLEKQLHLNTIGAASTSSPLVNVLFVILALLYVF